MHLARHRYYYSHMHAMFAQPTQPLSMPSVRAES